MNASLLHLSWPWLTAAFAAALLAVVAAAAGCHRLHPAAARAPLLDVWIGLLSWAPWLAGAACAGWRGLLASVAAQVVALHLFCWGDRLLRGGGPTIKAALEKMVGFSRNQFGLYVTLTGLPILLQIRLAQCALYPLLVRAVKFPKYRHGDWIGLSRQKFEGLTGYDLVFCLYCEWAAGVYGLGAEMLRNIESFWCPIRFHDAGRCENCRRDFPDIGQWVKSDGKMEEVCRELKNRYADRSSHSWWGHPDRH